ncbi:hypothetical protein CRE_01952 [Caenorhabditis remanei]|uniref:Domain of unknown function WSN domain-containing protein n=1 Tax=Caenorhabditis remanei TaxID=31234 RepID=E3LGG9_CAERE|nr:hypothetical protein CRE_01952 [Caenorhabditis remanei]
MKVWYLLLIGIFSVHCQNAPSSTYDPPVSRVAKQPNRNGKEGLFSRISEMIGAYARVTIGLHILGELIEPTSENLAIAGYMNINESIVDAWMKVNGKDSKIIIKEITSIKTSGFQVNGFLSEIAAFEDIFTQFEKLPPIHTEQQFTEMGEIVKNWQSVTDFPLTRLQALEREVNVVVEQSETTDYNKLESEKKDDLEKLNKKAMRAMKLYPQELRTMANHLKMFNGVLDFTDLYGPIKERIEIIKSYQTRKVSSLKIGTLAELQKMFSESTKFNIGSRIAQMIQLLTRMDDTSSLGRIWPEVFRNEFTELAVLKEDLDSKLLKDTLNKGEDLEVLKKVLDPIFDIGKIVSLFWTDSDAIFKDNDFRTHIDAIEPLLTNMAGVESFGLDKSVAVVTNMFNLTAIPDELNSFVDHYDGIMTKLEEYQEILRNIEEYQKEADYQRGLKLIENVDEWSAAFGDFTGGNNDALRKKINEEKYSPFQHKITNKFQEFNDKLQTLRDSLSKVNFTLFPSTGVKLLTDVTNTLNKTLINNKLHLSQVKAALNFIKAGQGIGGNKFDELVTKLSKLETIITEKKKQLNTEREKLKESPDAEYYKEVVKLNKGFELKEKLVAGSNLFKIFDKIVRDTKFDNFFEAGDVLYKKIQEVPFSNKNRFKLILKMKKLQTIKSRYEELKQEILLRKHRYNNVPMENLIQLRWLIENLYELPNPELKVEEWKQFAGLESLKNNTSGGNELANFEKAIEGISDLDFAEYQKNVPNTYANLRALIRFHNAILATEKVSSKTFWDWNHQWIEIVGFVAITLILNALAYGGAALYIRKKNMTPEELAERKERKERKKLEEKEESEEKAKNKTDPNSKAKEKKGTTTNVKARR